MGLNISLITGNKHKLYHITYLIKSDNNSEEFTEFIKSENLSIFNSESKWIKSKYYVVKVINERKLNEADNILEYTEDIDISLNGKINIIMIHSKNNSYQISC